MNPAGHAPFSFERSVNFPAPSFRKSAQGTITVPALTVGMLVT